MEASSSVYLVARLEGVLRHAVDLAQSPLAARSEKLRRSIASRLSRLHGAPRQASNTAVLELCSNGPTSTASVSLDAALGGGVFAGEVTEVFGESGSGKTYLSCQVVAYATRSSKAVVLCSSTASIVPRLHEVMAAASHSEVSQKSNMGDARQHGFSVCPTEVRERVCRLGRRRDIEDYQFECYQRLEAAQSKIGIVKRRLKSASAKKPADESLLRQLRTDEKAAKRSAQSEIRRMQFLAAQAPPASAEEVDVLQWSIDRIDAGLSDPLDPVQWEADRRLSNVAACPARGLRELLDALQTLAEAMERDALDSDGNSTPSVPTTLPDTKRGAGGGEVAAAAGAGGGGSGKLPPSSTRAPGSAETDGAGYGDTSDSSGVKVPGRATSLAAMCASPKWPWEATGEGTADGSTYGSGSELLRWRGALPSPREYACKRWSDVGLVVVDGVASMVAEDLAAVVRSRQAASGAGPGRPAPASAQAAAAVRTREAFGLLARVSSTLRYLATSFHVAVLVTNSAVRSKLGMRTTGGPITSAAAAALQPALGAAWAHGIDTSIQLMVDNSKLEAYTRQRLHVASTGPSLSFLTGAAAPERESDKQLLAGAEDEVLQGAAEAASRRHGEGTGRAVLVRKLRSRPRIAVVRASPRLPPPINRIVGQDAGGMATSAGRELCASMEDTELALPPLTLAPAAGSESAPAVALPSQAAIVQSAVFIDGDRPCVQMLLAHGGLVDAHGIACPSPDEVSRHTGDDGGNRTKEVPDWLGLLPGAAASAAAGLSMHLQRVHDDSL